MSQRNLLKNQCLMFVTTNTKDKKPVFRDAACARIAVESLYRVQWFNPFFLYAFVVMPDHCHFLLHVPSGKSIATIMHAYKRAVNFEIGKQIWQSRFHLKIVSPGDKLIEYIHLNPVRKYLSESAKSYPWSSASGRWDVLEFPSFQKGIT
jgi:REP element-mobilizing transposase RayT